MSITVEALADQLYVQTGDVAVIAGWFGEHYRQTDNELPDPIAAGVRLVLDPHAERTEPGLYGATGEL